MSDEQHTARIWQALNDASHAMLVTLDGGAVRARPMALYIRHPDERVYFLTDVRTHKDNEIQADPRVCITLDEGDFLCSVSGTAETSRDAGVIGDIWDDRAQAWFEGPDDPNLRLLSVRPEFGEYWDRPAELMASIKTTFAAMSGERPDMGPNEKVSM